jgi:tetratricopeptide (TPR) repeat protein
MARCCASLDARYTLALPIPRKPIHRDCREPTRTAELARHCTDAGLIEKAAGLWGKAAQQSQLRSAKVEAAAQLTRALVQIATLPATPALRREQIKLQVGLINPLMHVKGFAAPETKAAAEQARLLIEQAQALGEGPEDALLLYSVLYSFWAANYVAFNGDMMRELAAQFLALAEKQGGTVPLMVGHRLTGTSLLCTGDIAQSGAHLDRAIALYHPAEHRALGTRFGQDVRVAALSYRSRALWLLGYPDAALAHTSDALRDAREIGHAHTVMYALGLASWTHVLCGNYVAANTQLIEVVALADEKGAFFAKAAGMLVQGWFLALTGKASDAVQTITSGITAVRSTGSTVGPWYLSYLARAHAELGQIDDAWRCMSVVFHIPIDELLAVLLECRHAMLFPVLLQIGNVLS